MTDASKIADDFIERLRNHEISIDANATKITYDLPNYSKFGIGNKLFDEEPTKESLSAALARTMSNYELETDPKQKDTRARNLVAWINRAYSHSVIHDGSATFKKIEELEKRLSVLQTDYDELMKIQQKTADDNIAWQNKHAECRELYEKLMNTLATEAKIE